MKTWTATARDDSLAGRSGYHKSLARKRGSRLGDVLRTFSLACAWGLCRRILLAGQISVAVLLAGCGTSEKTLVADSDKDEAQPSAEPSTETPKAKEDDLEQEKQQVESVAASFVDACMRSDRAGVLTTLTEAAQKNLSEFENYNPDAAGFKGMTYELEETTIDGSTAEVVLRLSSRQAEEMLKALLEAGREIPEAQRKVQWKIQLRRESTEWRVFARTATSFVGPSPTIDYERLDPAKGPAQFIQRDPKEADPFPQTLTVAEFEGSWQRDFEYQNQPAQEVLDQLAKDAGLEWAFAPAVQRPVSLSLQGRSVVEAIEAVCRQIDRHPDYPEFSRSSRRLRLKEGLRPFPYQMVGPFMVYVTDIETFAGKTTGRLKLRCVGLGLPSDVGYHEKRLDVHAIRDSAGTDIYDVDDSFTLGWTGREGPNHYVTEAGLPLKNLVRGSQALMLQASLSVLVPTNIQAVSFGSLESGAQQSVGGVTITVDEVTTAASPTRPSELQSRIRLTCASSAPDAASPGVSGNSQRRGTGPPLADKIRQITFFCYDHNGEQLDAAVLLLSSLRTGYHILRPGSGQRSRSTLAFAGQAKSLRAFLTTAAEEVVYDINLDIPLPSAALLPEQVVPAKFPGHAAPVTVTFLGLVGDPFRKVEVKIVNHSDKAIRELNLRVIYRDASAENVSEASAKHGYMSRTPDKPYFLEKQGQARVKLDHAPFIPEEAAAAELALERVVFADATEWTPDMETALTDREPQEQPPFRQWTDKTGKFAVEARFLRLQDGKAVLEKRDGTTIQVAPEQLSAKDQENIQVHEQGVKP